MSLDCWWNYGIILSLLLSNIGSDTTGFRAKVKAPFSLPSRKTWKQSRTALRSMECELSLWLNPAENLKNIFKILKIDIKTYKHSLWKGSTLICSLSWREASISFFFTHWIPRLGNEHVIVATSSSIVQTPFLHPSLPTKLWGWGL